MREPGPAARGRPSTRGRGRTAVVHQRHAHRLPRALTREPALLPAEGLDLAHGRVLAAEILLPRFGSGPLAPPVVVALETLRAPVQAVELRPGGFALAHEQHELAARGLQREHRADRDRDAEDVGDIVAAFRFRRVIVTNMDRTRRLGAALARLPLTTCP